MAHRDERREVAPQLQDDYSRSPMVIVWAAGAFVFSAGAVVGYALGRWLS